MKILLIVRRSLFFFFYFSIFHRIDRFADNLNYKNSTISGSPQITENLSRTKILIFEIARDYYLISLRDRLFVMVVNLRFPRNEGFAGMTFHIFFPAILLEKRCCQTSSLNRGGSAKFCKGIGLPSRYFFGGQILRRRSYTKIGWSAIEMKNETGFHRKEISHTRNWRIRGVCFGEGRSVYFGNGNVSTGINGPAFLEGVSEEKQNEITRFEGEKKVFLWKANLRELPPSFKDFVTSRFGKINFIFLSRIIFEMPSKQFTFKKY